MAIGKISGVLLKDNLERQGVNLSFDGNLVYLDVTARRLGVGTSSPQYGLDVPANVRVANLTILGNTITSNTGRIGLGSISSLVVTGGDAYNVILTDGAGNLRFGTLDEISGNTNFTGNTIELGLNSLGTFGGNALALTQLTSVTDSIAQLNQLLGNITNTAGTVIHVSGNVDSTVVNTQTLRSTDVYGTLQTVTQPNITNVGTLLGLSIDGDLTVTGNTTFVGPTDLIVSDSILSLHRQSNLSPWETNDGKDIGIKMNYYDTQDSYSALVRSNATGYLEWYSRGDEGAGNVFVGNAYGVIKTGELIVANITPATGPNTGALQVWGGASISGDLYIGNLQADLSIFAAINDTPIGNAVPSTGAFTTLDANTATLGDMQFANSTITTDDVLVINSNTALQIPVGGTSQRPTGADGMIRYNTDTPALEYYNGTIWVPVTNTVTSQQITGDGLLNTFTLDQQASTVGVIVSINGTLQHPVSAYTVVGDQITFTETPEDTDIIDVRFLGAAVTVSETVYDDLTILGNLTLTGLLSQTLTTKTSTSPGTAGQISWDANYIYVCTAANTWKRVALSGGVF
jgi:hypothetical protein